MPETSFDAVVIGSGPGGLADGGPILASVVGVGRFDNWSALTPQEEKDRRER